jgi:hypothetical protein
MEWLETNPLPAVCLSCEEADCYNCDHAGERWKLSERDELILRRKMLSRSVERMQRQIAEIDERLIKM